VEQAGDPPRGDAYIYVRICGDCVARFAEQLARQGPETSPEPA
jgi:hypothetical protein